MRSIRRSPLMAVRVVRLYSSPPATPLFFQHARSSLEHAAVFQFVLIALHASNDLCRRRECCGGRRLPHSATPITAPHFGHQEMDLSPHASGCVCYDFLLRVANSVVGSFSVKIQRTPWTETIARLCKAFPSCGGMNKVITFGLRRTFARVLVGDCADAAVRSGLRFSEHTVLLWQRHRLHINRSRTSPARRYET